MIQCPKCNFPQPEDTYCANCGINMSTYVEKKSRLSILNHWLTQVFIIFMCIVGFVLYDQMYNRKSAPPVPTNSLPVATKMNINDIEPEPATDTPVAESSLTPADLRQRRQAKAFLNKKNTSETDQNIPAETSALKTQKRQTGLQVSFYKATKQALLELQRRSQAVTVSGESSAGQLPKERFQSLVASREIQYISGARYKDFDDQHPTMIFKGQRHTEAARNLGLFFQMTALKQSESLQLIEVKGWGALKALEPDENYFSGEMAITPSTVTYISGFVPRTGTYTDDEKQLFEKDRLLKELNDEDFNEGQTDLIMLIEFNTSH